MLNIQFLKINLYSFLYLFLNISFSLQITKDFKISIKKQQLQLGFFYITYSKFLDSCDEWIISLFNPILLAKKCDITGVKVLEKYELNNPIFFKKDPFSITVLQDIKFLEYDMFLGKEYSLGNIDYCYFGISSGLAKYDELNENQINLNYLKEKGKIDKRIFSFDKWEINTEWITSSFHFGDFNSIFNSNDGIIGTCDSDPKNLSWGCFFQEIIFNNISIPLKDDNGNLIKVYFASEIHHLIFPTSFQEKFIEASKNDCEYHKEKYSLVCKDFFNSNNYFPIIFKNENMEITGEIDNENRFNIENINKEFNSRIIFKDNEYIILPLIVFKNFYIQFDGENNKISFYTQNKDILKVKSKEENNNESSSRYTIILVILIILFIIVIAIGILFFIKNRKGNVEKSINKFNKLEEEEDFHNMNENRVF